MTYKARHPWWHTPLNFFQFLPDFSIPFLSSKNTSLLALALSYASLACAQPADEGNLTAPDHTREGGRISLSVSSKVDYSDSDASRASVKPELEYQWANGWFVGTNRGVGYNFSKDPSLQYGLGLGYDLGRKESTTGALAGMGRIDSKVKIGAFMAYAPNRHWRLSSVLRYGSGDTGQGLSANLAPITPSTSHRSGVWIWEFQPLGSTRNTCSPILASVQLSHNRAATRSIHQQQDFVT